MISANEMCVNGVVTNASGLETLPRIGLHFSFPQEFKNMEWYGRGEVETYPDRKSTIPIGIYHSQIESQQVPYLRPCECGGHEDTTYVKLDSEKNSIICTGGKPFHFSALPYSVEAYSRVKIGRVLSLKYGCVPCRSWGRYWVDKEYT
jgi:beta-galactosidase